MKIEDIINTINEDTECVRAEYDVNEGRERYLARVAAEGLFVQYPKPNELLIDLDTKEQVDEFLSQIKLLVREVVILKIEVTTSFSGNRHVYIQLDRPISPIERIAWQAALGSDPKRELLSLIRASRGDKFPTILVETTEERADVSVLALIKDDSDMVLRRK